MLWGKTVLLWTADYEQARSWLFHLNDKYALDGRDPNSYSGILWVLGRYDRAAWPGCHRQCGREQVAAYWRLVERERALHRKGQGNRHSLL